jgi:3-oxoacyl-[acyl-carrier protein] reductase
VLCCKAVAPGLVAQGSGRIILVGSVAGLQGRPDGVAYATAKAALHEYTRCLAVQLREHNVAVNAVAPGGTVTHRFMANLGRDYDGALGECDTVAAEGGLVRLALPRDIGNVVGMLLSPDAAFISGQVIRVDGGAQTFPC